jgi:SAM-dependent methyltransferase
MRRSAQRPPQAAFFRHALPCQLVLQEVTRVMGPTDGLRCLNVGDEGGVYAYRLRKLGGEWSTVVGSEEEAELARGLVEDDVHAATGAALPFGDKQFDIVLVLNHLETVADDEHLVEECHRVLKRDGMFFVNAAHRKAYTPLTGLLALLGATPERRGLVRPGYSESHMFRILKHGFDVNNMRTYMRFFVAIADGIVRRRVPLPLTAAGLSRLARRTQVASPFYRLAFQLDLLLFFSRGFFMLCTAKRRAWLPRKTPVLADGRSISEAVLSRAID